EHRIRRSPRRTHARIPDRRLTAPGCQEKTQVTALIVYSSPTGWFGFHGGIPRTHGRRLHHSVRGGLACRLPGRLTGSVALTGPVTLAGPVTLERAATLNRAVTPIQHGVEGQALRAETTINDSDFSIAKGPDAPWCASGAGCAHFAQRPGSLRALRLRRRQPPQSRRRRHEHRSGICRPRQL